MSLKIAVTRYNTPSKLIRRLDSFHFITVRNSSMGGGGVAEGSRVAGGMRGKGGVHGGGGHAW